MKKLSPKIKAAIEKIDLRNAIYDHQIQIGGMLEHYAFNISRIARIAKIHPVILHNSLKGLRIFQEEELNRIIKIKHLSNIKDVNIVLEKTKVLLEQFR